MIIEASLSLIPAAFTFCAWNTQRTSESSLTRRRKILFGIGLVVSVLCCCFVTLSWIDPFPLVTMRGGLVDIYEEVFFVGAGCTAVFTILLALFGRRLSRILLIASGLMLFALSYGALLQNGV
jgi:hypothetical protein